MLTPRRYLVSLAVAVDFRARLADAKPELRGTYLMSDVLERVRKIVIEHLDADPEKVTEKASFIDDLGADSLDNVELVMAFEEEFDIEIPDDAAEHIQTVGDAVKFITERLGAA
jgi:acyl carrier protein